MNTRRLVEGLIAGAYSARIFTESKNPHWLDTGLQRSWLLLG